MKKSIINAVLLLIVPLLIIVGIKIASDNSNNNNNPIDEPNIPVKTNLKDMKKEDITFDDQKINIYLFWGNGCSHCHHLSLFFDSLDEELKSHFKLYSFEVWHNEENQEFMNEFAELVNKKPSGVPFLIIGEKTFFGFSEETKKEIQDALEEEIDKSEHFDYYKNSLN